MPRLPGGTAIRTPLCRRGAGGINTHRGFTLVEILIVLVIMGIALALVTINMMPDDKRTLAVEAERLSLLLEQAHDDAVAGAERIGWSAGDGGYRFWRADEKGEWVPLAGDETLRERTFQPGVKLVELKINRHAVAEGERLVFTPSGMGLPFDAVLALKDERIALSGDGFGAVRVGAAVERS